MEQQTQFRFTPFTASDQTTLLPLLCKALLLSLGFFLAAVIGIDLTREAGNVAALWPPNALLLAALLRTPPAARWRVWPLYLSGCLAANVAANLWFGDALWVALGFTACNALEVLAGAFLISRFIRDTSTPELSIQQQLIGAALAGLLAPTLSASAGAWLIHTAYGADFSAVWPTWWVADAMGMLIIAPLALTATRSNITALLKTPAESITTLALVIMLGVLVFTQSMLPLVLLLLPALIWTAFRLGFFGCALAGVMVSLIAISLTVYGYGPLPMIIILPAPTSVPWLTLATPATSAQIILWLQLFLGVTVLPALLMAIFMRQRLQDEQALRASETRYRSLYEDTPVMMHSVNAQGRLLDVNQRWLDTLGYQQEEVIGQFALDFVTEDSRQKAQISIPQVYKNGHIRDIPRQFVKKNGDTIDVMLSAYAEYNTDGTVKRVLAVAADVTERNRAERALKQRTAQQAAVARLGQRALAGASLQTILEQAATLLTETLDVSSSSVLEYLPAQSKLQMRAGVGLLTNAVGKMTVAAELNTQAGYTLNHGQPVIVTDLQQETRFSSPTQSAHGIRSSISCTIAGPDGVPFGVLGTHSTEPNRFTEADARFLESVANVLGDAVQRQHADNALWEEKERLYVTLQSIGDAVITTDANARVVFMNPVAEALTGWLLEKAQGQPLENIFVIVDDTTLRPIENPVQRCLEKQHIVGLPEHTQLVSRTGEHYAVQDSAAPIRDSDGKIHGAVMVFQDVTEARELNRKISHQARHDTLTGLMNRCAFEERLQNALSRSQEQHVLCYLDLDKFKIVNDTAGHVAGDALLKQIAHVLKHRIRDTDALARIGGDEFGLLLENCPLDKATTIAEQIVSAVQDIRFSWKDRIYEIGLSLGLTTISAETDSLEAALSQADVACYAAKSQGRNRVVVYQSDDNDSLRRHQELERVATLRQALENEQFCLYGQPIRRLNSTDSKPVFYELLIRLRDSDGNIILPGAFIPAAERYDLMPSIDRWVIRTALQRYATLFNREAGVSMTLNLSGTSLNDKTLLAFILEQISNSSVPPEHICFEITETAAINNLVQATQFITALRKRGCRIALDDFGSGFCSVNYLKMFPVDYLKIDGSFVRTLTENPVDHAVVQSINHIAQIMGVQTIAEYVENDQIIDRLQTIGVDFVQGYGIGRPQPLEQLLDASSTPPVRRAPALRVINSKQA